MSSQDDGPGSYRRWEPQRMPGYACDPGCGHPLMGYRAKDHDPVPYDAGLAARDLAARDAARAGKTPQHPEPGKQQREPGKPQQRESVTLNGVKPKGSGGRQ